MFLVNSRLGLFSAATLVAPFIPKLQGHFAEFLNKGSPARLRILSSPTCVGLRYGRLRFVAAFLASVNSTASLLIFSPHHDPGLLSVLHYLTPSSLGRALPVTRSVYPSVSLLQSNAKGGTGISTSCPSPTTFVLGLGPDLP